MAFIRDMAGSGWRAMIRRPSLAWAGAGAAVLAAAGAAVPAGDSAPAGKTAPVRVTSQRQSPGAAGPLPVVVIGEYAGRGPGEIGISADGGNIVTGIRWQSWTASGAAGRGSSGIQDCVPDCADGTVRYVPTMISLSVPVNGRFTVLKEIREGKVTLLHWPAQWPLDAQTRK